MFMSTAWPQTRPWIKAPGNADILRRTSIWSEETLSGNLLDDDGSASIANLFAWDETKDTLLQPAPSRCIEDAESDLVSAKEPYHRHGQDGLAKYRYTEEDILP